MPAEVPHWGVDIEGRPAVWMKGTDVVELIGESQRQAHLERIAGPPRPGLHQVEVAAWLLPDGSNAAQPVIAVQVAGDLVGYVPAPLARVWHPVITGLSARWGRPVACFGKIVGGMRRATDGEGGYYSVRLFLPPPPL